MSTILKALRRLEEDTSIDAPSSSTFYRSPSSLPATDPHATDELRSRILAEELAAEASGGDVVDSSITKKRVLIATAIAVSALVTTLIVGLGLGFRSPTPDDYADADVDADAVVAVSPSPSPLLPSPVSPVPVALEIEQAPPEAASPAEDPSNVDTSVRLAAIPVVQSDSSRASSKVSANPATPKLQKTVPSSQSPKRLTDEHAAPAPRQEMPLAAVVPTTASLESESVAGAATSPRPRSSAPAGAISARRSTARPTPTRAERRATNAEAAVSAAKPPSKSTPEPEIDPEPRPRAVSMAKPEAAAVEEHKSRAIPDVSVLRTAWHPSPDRRSAKIRLLATKETMTLKEGDAVGGLVIQKISPSAVLFRSGEVEIRLRVGQRGSGS